MRDGGSRGKTVPQAPAVNALKGAQLQQAEQHPRPEAGFQSDITIGHQLDEADQNARHKNFCHAPVTQLKQDTCQTSFEADGQRDRIDQQNNGDHAEGRNRLHKQQKQCRQAAVIFRHHDLGDLRQRDLAGQPRHFHGDKRKQIRQQQHKQRRQRITRRPFTRLVPVSRQRGMAAWA